jgi:CHAT domain-containing protein/tetratricopeptide (TPR) repeat protein
MRRDVRCSVRQAALAAPAILIAAAIAVPVDGAPGPAPGIVVLEVGRGSAPERAGLREGDLLLGWRRPGSPRPAKGAFETPFDLDELELAEAPRGEIVLTVQRDAGKAEIVVPAADWSVSARPRFTGRDLADWDEGARLKGEGGASGATDGGRLAGIAAWKRIVARRGAPASRGERRLLWWLRLRIAGAWAEAGESSRSSALVRRVATEAGRLGDVAVAAVAREREARRLEEENEPDRAGKAWQLALALRERLSPGGLATAAILTALGNLAQDRGDLAAAERLHRRGLALRERWAPESLVVAGSLNCLGAVAWERGELDVAEGYFERALAIGEERAPGSRPVSGYLNNLGAVADERGDQARAEDLYGRGLAILEKIGPGLGEEVVGLNNVGLVAQARGDLARAEELLRRALEIRERISPGSLGAADSLTNLGNVAAEQGNLDEAEEMFRRALAINQELAPWSLDVATGWNGLGNLARMRKELPAAEDLHRRALAIYEILAPGSLDVAMSLLNLAEDRQGQGDPVGARELDLRALEIQNRLAPDSLAVASALASLGEISVSLGRPDEAKELFDRSLAIASRLAPGSTLEAQVHHDRAGVCLQLGQIGSALDSFCEAVQSIELQSGRLGGSNETQSEFAASWADWYREYATLLVEAGDAAGAFHLLERSRARGLLALLAERDLWLVDDVPSELERERRRAAADYDRAKTQLAALRATDEAGLEELEPRLREIRRRQDEIRERIRRASPRFASLVYPEPLDLVAASDRLDPGTLLLVYCIGEESGLLFALEKGNRELDGVEGPGRLTVHPIPVGRDRLGRQVDRFRTAIRRAGTTRSRAWRAELRRQSANFSRTLLAPVADRIAGARRLLVIPDGPLRALPFAALAAPDPEGEGGPSDADGAHRFLVELKPVHTVVSMTVYEELLRERPERRGGGMARAAGRGWTVAFGDPAYSERGIDHRVGRRIDRLPATRSEVESIRDLDPDSTCVLLGADATEAAAKALGRDVDAVHFACHGILDERFPLDSALALTPPGESSGAPAEGGEDNGLLQAWEIFEKVRIDADLVALSACETAMGKETGGEGLVGLARAFEYAGAHSVLASLWSVSDESTARLMACFYRGWREGLPKDEALQRAQVELLTSDRSHPFHWAGFELIGDWR